VAVDLQLRLCAPDWFTCFCNLHCLFFHCSLAACLTSKMVSVADHALPPVISLYRSAALPCILCSWWSCQGFSATPYAKAHLVPHICGCFCYDICYTMALSQKLSQKLHEYVKFCSIHCVRMQIARSLVILSLLPLAGGHC